VIAVTVLAMLLLAAVPAALLTAVIMMILGHVVGVLALFGGSVLAAVMAVALGMTGMQHLRKLLSGASFNVMQQDHSQSTDNIAEPNGSDYTDASISAAVSLAVSSIV
jgi:uncharacterized membrane protein YdjX (TVP38/TMEM64 family)